MKSVSTLAMIFSSLLFIFAAAAGVHAGTVEDIKEGSKKAARNIRDGAVEAGKATVKTGREIKEGSKKAWKNVKKGMKEAGKDFKNAYMDTRDAIREEISDGNRQTESSKKDPSRE